MTKKEHIEDHVRLHNALDELVADFIMHTEKIPSRASFMELMAWSNSQTENPTVRK